jgi:hypothetical protein
MDALSQFADLDLWVTWRTEQRAGGKTPSKVPYAIDGRLAKANDPTTWMTRAQATTAAAAHGEGGINIVLGHIASLNLNLGAVDLDSCLGDEGDVALWAEEVVDLLQSYTEVSPSGNGLKIFFTYPADALTKRWRKHVQKPNPDGGKDHGIEFYLDRHFTSVTAATFQSYDTLREITLEDMAELQALMTIFAGEPKRPDAPRNHPRRPEVDDIDRLYDAIGHMPNRDLSWEEWNTCGMAIHRATHGSESGRFAFIDFSKKSTKFDIRNCTERWENWRRSPPDQLSDGSIYHWAKEGGWQDPRLRKPRTNGHDTGEEPVADHDIGRMEAQPKAPRFDIASKQVTRWEGLDLPELAMLVDQFIPLKVAGILAGDGGAGKSYIAQLLCTCVATGFAFCGRRVQRGRAVLITGEDPEEVQHIRQHRLNEALGYAMHQLDHLHLVSMVDNDIFLFSNGRVTGLLEDLIVEIEEITGVTLLVIDSAAIVYDDDEIRRQPVSKFMIALNRAARRIGCTILLITHKSRSGGSGAGTFTSGSTGWAAHARCGFDVIRDTEGEMKLNLVKPNYTEPSDPVTLEWRRGVPTYKPDKPVTQLDLITQNTSTKLLLSMVHLRWRRTGNGFLKRAKGLASIEGYMAGEHKWKHAETTKHLDIAEDKGWLRYVYSGKKRGWKITPEGLAEIGRKEDTDD